MRAPSSARSLVIRHHRGLPASVPADGATTAAEPVPAASASRRRSASNFRSSNRLTSFPSGCRPDRRHRPPGAGAGRGRAIAAPGWRDQPSQQSSAPPPPGLSSPGVRQPRGTPQPAEHGAAARRRGGECAADPENPESNGGVFRSRQDHRPHHLVRCGCRGDRSVRSTAGGAPGLQYASADRSGGRPMPSSR